MTEPVAILLRDFKEVGIRFKKEYLQSYLQERSAQFSNNRYLAVEELKQHFLNQDIKETSIPIVPDTFGETDVDIFPPEPFRQGSGVVLQIVDTWDIQNSAFSLLNKLNNATPVRHVYIESEGDEQVDIPRGLLVWRLSDGRKQFPAMELETIQDLSLKTPYGCKLLVKNCQVLRGTLMLKPENVTVLGGNIPGLYGNDMIKELKKRLQEKLDDNRAPDTPLPTATSRPAPSYTTSSNTRLNQQISLSNRPPPSQPADEISPEVLNQIFNDDIDFDMDIDPDNTNNHHHQQQHTSQIIPQTNFNSTMTDVFSDDDSDFVPKQPSIPRPPRFTASSSTPSLSLSKKRAHNNTQASSTNISLSKKRTRSNSQESHLPISNQSSLISMDIDNEVIIPVKKEKTEKPDDTIWMNTNFSDDDDDDNDEENSVNSKYATFNFRDGKWHITFEKLKELLSVLDRQSVNVSFDTVYVKAKWKRLAKLKYGSNSGLWGVVNIGDPDLNEPCCSSAKLNTLCDKCIQITLKNQIFAKVLDMDINDNENLDATMRDPKGQKWVVKYMNKQQQDQQVQLELDLSVIERWQGETGDVQGPIMLQLLNFQFLGKNPE